MNPVVDKIVVLGADHNGVALKEQVKKLLVEHGYACIDVGSHDGEVKVDYVDYAKTVANIVNSGEAARGVLICGTGVGMSMAANRFPNVRASLVHSVDVSGKTREHNDANVLCLGAWVNPLEVNLDIIERWFSEAFGEGRHVKRVEKIKGHSKEKIVFTNGVFDLLHAGHIELLRSAKSLGGRLVVGLNSDRVTKLLKGPDRPIQNERQRKSVLESLGFVDQVIIFDDTGTQGIVREIHPNVLVKGGEWTAAEVRKRDSVPTDIEVVVFPLLMNPEAPGTKYSTTEIVKKIRGTRNT